MKPKREDYSSRLAYKEARGAFRVKNRTKASNRRASTVRRWLEKAAGA